MLIISGVLLSFLLLIVVSIVVILFKRIILGKSIGVYYTPFDNITGNTSIEFHEEQNEEENEDDQGDDKDKNKKENSNVLKK
ncbi:MULTISPECIES: DUF3951 domain-containing protein [Bacillus]|uniref:DUF3951 domain-containing protein n=1 Tax=Bacillus pumilus TaxID=1408 RepID=A0AAD0MM87_BACPU|nr:MULTISPECIES: DUF3951 domain-containing protein [Bacillus]KOA77232.1 hypothetical protein ACR53_11850 [Bacillus stratosphericus]APJ11943.1 hypothetical protein BSL056_13650 [Bacillus safensis]AVM24823.1 DUF3951 domain-containing protein [Bacillus pumilus]MBU4620434.1 DUF3951 domain-containing protein [Bacillus sp. GG161]TYS40211.1 DUF3951 domain-containing protein [Bacillus pumilus]